MDAVGRFRGRAPLCAAVEGIMDMAQKLRSRRHRHPVSSWKMRAFRRKESVVFQARPVCKREPRCKDYSNLDCIKATLSTLAATMVACFFVSLNCSLD